MHVPLPDLNAMAQEEAIRRAKPAGEGPAAAAAAGGAAATAPGVASLELPEPAPGG
eukprot:gene9277-6847_t